MKIKCIIRDFKILIFSLCLSSVFFTSCGKNGCTDSTALNYDDKAKKDDGTCRISGCTDVNADNYNPKANENSNDCILSREKFIGTYNVLTTCTQGASYNMEISTSAVATNKVLINNINNLGATVTATVKNNLITIDTQDFQDSFGDTWSVTSNSGSLSGSVVSIIVTYEFSEIELKCDETWTK